MSKFNTQNLDVKKTIEATLNRAKGWSFGVYPSTFDNNKKIKIDVRYPGEDIPSFKNEKDELSHQKLNFSQQPSCVIIQRGDTRLILKKSTSSDNNGSSKKSSYILAIHTSHNQNYRIIETPDGTVKEKGNILLMWDVQKDYDFNQYISFFSQNENTRVSTKKWDLNKMMAQSREIV